MRSIDINKKIVSLVEKMYEKTTCTVVVDWVLTEWFSVSVGVRQGCHTPQLCLISSLTL